MRRRREIIKIRAKNQQNRDHRNQTKNQWNKKLVI
jgi:hypothetical protein